jgi:glycosyltransferase involved in cell wall biosynthesis
MAQQSALFRHRRVEVIPNCLDTELFRPVAKETVRKELALPSDRTILAFGALGGTDVVYKGYHLLLDALRVLKNSTKRDYHLVIFGSAGDTRQLPFPATFFGKLTDQRSLAAAFQCADLFVHPSQQDNFPGTVVEASACGVPVVAFDIGGIGDIVMHRTTGYLAQPFDVADLARGIELLTDGTLSAAEVGASARSHIVRYCSPHTVADRYIQLYQDLLVAEPLI